MNMQCGHLSAGLGYYVRDSGLLDVLRRSDKRALAHTLSALYSQTSHLWCYMFTLLWHAHASSQRIARHISPLKRRQHPYLVV